MAGGPSVSEGAAGVWQEESPLGLLGCRVGKTRGLPRRERQEILRRAFEAHLPNAFDPTCAEQWGAPGTRRRYRRIREHLRHQIELRETQRRMKTAVEHWSEDLRWFEETFAERFDGA